MTNHTRAVWHVHIDMAAIGRDPAIAKSVTTSLISDHTDVEVDKLDFYVSDDRVLVRVLSEADANALVQTMDQVLIASRQWVAYHGHNVYASQTEEELEVVDGVGPVWIQRRPGKTFKKIYPTHLYSESA